METIAKMYELLAMADGPKLLAGTSDAKPPQNLSFTDTIIMIIIITFFKVGVVNSTSLINANHF